MNHNAEGDDRQGTGGAFAPLREPVFRRIWTASILSNFGQLILGVAAAWEMTRLTDSASMVALVQTALMLPLMLVALPAGALADMFDRRKIAMWGLAFSTVCAAILAVIAFFDHTTPWILLAFCALIGVGVALYGPSWQASIPEQVSRAHLPAAVALGTISYNVARSVGPAVGGVIVLLAGAKVVFALTSVFFVPLFVAFMIWQRRHVPSRLPPERIDRAIMTGARYSLHSPGIRITLTRVFAFGLATATAVALAPLIAKDVLQGGAGTFGLLLGIQGVGAVSGALFVSRMRDLLETETAIRILALGAGLSLVAIGLSHSLVLTGLAFFVVGACSIVTIALLNVSVQFSAPRWVVARALSLFSSAITAGIGIGAWLWGTVAASHGVTFAFILSGIVTTLTVGLGLIMRLSSGEHENYDLAEIGHLPTVAMPLTLRSGPIAVEIRYDVDPARAREFYDVLVKMQGVRKRNGGFQWSIARDIADPALWTERYHCPTWGDYLRMRDRYTQNDAELQARADAFHRGGDAGRVTRQLERPFGSVRWKAESPDPQQETINYYGPLGSG